MAGDANVRVVVSAITEAAEQALDEVGEDMAGLSDDALAAQTGLDQLSDEMSQAERGAIILQTALGEMSDEMRDSTLAAQLLQGALDEVGEEARQASASSAAASSSFSTLSISAGAASLSVGTLSKAFTLSLIPAVLTAATVLAPAVALLTALAAGAVAVAGAFGLIIGSGILAFGDQMAQQNQEELSQTERLISQYETMRQQQGALSAQDQQRLRQLRKKKSELEDQTTVMGALQAALADVGSELRPLIVDFGREFIPLIREALDAIPELAEEMMNAVGGTEEFRDALRDFGAGMAEVLPPLTGAFFELARDALPLVRELFSWIADNGGGIWAAILQSVNELEPQWRDLLDALIEMGPVLLEFGTNVGKVLIPAIADLIRGLTWLMEAVNDMEGPWQNIVISALLLAPVLVKIAGLASSLATLLGFNGLTGAIASLATWLATSVGGWIAIGAAIGLVGVKILDMIGVLDGLMDIGSSARDLIGGDLADAMLTLASIMTLGLLPVIAAIGAAIIELVRGDIGGAVDNFEQVMGIFDDAFGNTLDLVVGGAEQMASAIMAAFGQAGSFLLGWISTMGNSLVSFFLDTLPGLVLDALTWMTAIWTSGFNRIYNIFADIWNSIAELGVGLMNDVLDTLERFINMWIDHVNRLVEEANDIPFVNVNTLDDVNGPEIQRDAFQVDQRQTDVGTLQRRQRDTAGDIAQQINQTEVQVDVGGDLRSNPHTFSRDLANQVNREQRTNNGA